MLSRLIDRLAAGGSGAPATGGGMPVSDALPFFRAWISNPLRVAAVAPSSGAVAALMTQDITPRTGPVLELGPGTGPFTYALLERGVPERDLTLVEYDRDLARLLEQRFPQARVLQMDAERLRERRPVRRRPRWGRHQRAWDSLDAAAQSDRHSDRRFRLHASRRRLLSDHLWPSLPGPRRDSRSPGSPGYTCRPDVPQHSAGGRLSHHPARAGPSCLGLTSSWKCPLPSRCS